MTAATAATDLPELVFPSGLPGFPGSTRFALTRWGTAEGPYRVLVDLDDPEVRFLVMPPALFFPDYEIDLDDATATAVNLKDNDEALILVIVSLGQRVEEATANLLGPIVINTRTREGIQAVLAETNLSTRVPLSAVAA